jgi:predicted nucleotidyltransferase
MGIDQTVIDEIVRRVTNVARAERIILFGSAATGQMTRDSDIDLLVVQADPGDRRKESVRIDETLSGLGYPFDVIVISSDWFEASKNVIGGIAYPANKYGKVIYEAA